MSAPTTTLSSHELRDAGLTSGSVLHGGLLDWQGSGFDVARGQRRWELERQVWTVAAAIDRH